MLKKPFNQLFNGDQKILDKLKIDLNLRPQNLDFETYYKLTNEGKIFLKELDSTWGELQKAVNLVTTKKQSKNE